MKLEATGMTDFCSVFPFNFGAAANRENTAIALPAIYGEYYNLGNVPAFLFGDQEFAGALFRYTAIQNWAANIYEEKSGYTAYKVIYTAGDRKMVVDGNDVAYIVFPRLLVTTPEHSRFAWPERSERDVGTLSFDMECLSAYITTAKRYGRISHSRLQSNHFMSMLSTRNGDAVADAVLFDTSYGMYGIDLAANLPQRAIEFICRGVRQAFPIAAVSSHEALNKMFGRHSHNRYPIAMRQVGIYAVEVYGSTPVPMVDALTGHDMRKDENILVGDVVSRVASLSYNMKRGVVCVKPDVSVQDIQMCKEYVTISDSYRNGNDFSQDVYYTSEQCYMSHFARHNGGQSKDDLAKKFSRALEYGVAKRARNENENYRDTSRSLERDIQRLEESLADKTKSLINLRAAQSTMSGMTVRQKLHQSILDVERSFASLKIDGICSTSAEQFLITMKPCYVTHGGKFYTTARVWVAFEKPEQYSRWAGIASISSVMMPSVKEAGDALDSITDGVRNVDVSQYIINYDMVGCIKRIRASIVNSFNMIAQGDVEAHVNCGVLTEVSQEEYHNNL